MNRFKFQWLMVFTALWCLSGCAASREAGPRQATGTPAQVGRQATNEAGRVERKKTCPDEIQDWGWRERTITEEELTDMENCEPGLDRSVCARILSSLNTRTELLIREDIRNRKPLKVPNDFRAYRHWNPLPKHVGNLSHIPKMILVVKDIPHLGWSERG
ncbi:MAG: hypothetical protein HGA63_10845, partial [Syntrophobacteraceae bacterium]|nr:hypothetical protein [Syntrophobacteraceae bacterium]